MSKLNVDAKEAALLAQRLAGGTLTLRANGFTVELPKAQVKIDARSFAFEGTVEKGLVKVDVQKIAIQESGIDVDFSLL